MMFGILVKTILLLAISKLSHGSIRCDSLKKRLCRAQFVFKFQVVSRAKKVCASPTLKAIVPSTNTPLKRAATTGTTQTLATTTSPMRQLVQNTLATAYAQNPQKGCKQVLHQTIFIPEDTVLRGLDILKKIISVKKLKIKKLYSSFIRLDLNFQDELQQGDFLFIGRPVGKIKDQLFLSNPTTVVPWSKSLQKNLQNFDFVKDCQKKTRLSRGIFCPIF
ncbi:uncharacterized protein LOC114518965 [Dendronephthya gigantea]|uniref:uncharacterized protein LOC114518965 n=1 Tax=Dendronephthya gigantea TaxID=151771 RepID=UPI0010692737|nr:uncharacterized protein LOC114518965 [Dendronephthya gigantea]